MITEDHGPSGFTWTNPVTGDVEYRPGSGVKKGNGSIEDPFVISGWCIGTFHPGQQNEWAGIHVSGTAMHAVIGENLVFGIVGGDGIFVGGARNLTILDNIVELVPKHGVHVKDAALIRVTGNLISRGNGDGVRFHGVSDSLILSNSIANVDQNGVRLLSSRRIVVEDNGVSSSGNPLGVACGLHLMKSMDNTVTQNEIYENRCPGVRFWKSHDNSLGDNEIERNEHKGVVIRESNWNSVYNNTISENGLNPLYLLRSTNNTFSENTISGLSIKVSASNGNYVVGNTAVNTIVSIDASMGNRLESNEFRRISLSTNANQNEVVYNNFTGALYAIILTGMTDPVEDTNRIWFNNILGADVGAALSHRGDVDMRHNWWGHHSGPGGEVIDQCTSGIADGKGANITTSNASVCFEPWLTQPNRNAGIEQFGDSG